LEPGGRSGTDPDIREIWRIRFRIRTYQIRELNIRIRICGFRISGFRISIPIFYYPRISGSGSGSVKIIKNNIF
ncbi:hypothetical protein BRARA_E01657, partial [Brassica rapa]